MAAFVAGEQRGVAEIEAKAASVHKKIGEQADIAHAEIETLAGDRMNDVRGIPDQLIKTELTREVQVDLSDPAARHSFPTWLAEKIAAVAPPGELDAILEGLNREPTLTLRVRPAGTREKLLEEQRGKQLEVEACDELPDAIRVTD